MWDALMDIATLSALGIAGWVFKQVSKIESIEDKVDHIRDRVDGLYDHFLK